MASKDSSAASSPRLGPSSSLRLSASASNLSRAMRSASQQALDQFNSIPRPAMPKVPRERTSFIRNATEENRRREIALQSLKKGLFLFVFSHGVLSGSKLAFALLGKRRAAKRGEVRPFLQVLQKVLGDASTRRLATFLGLYSTLWTLSYPALRKSGRRFDPDTGELVEKEATFASRWAAAIGGAIAGLALLAQNSAERVSLAPNLWCRGLYSILKHRPLIHLPHGDIVLFGLSNAQIISAFAMNPTTLPGWYWHWIRRTGTLSTEFMDVSRQLGRGTLADMTLPRLLLDKTAAFAVPFNETRAQAWLSSPQPLAYPGGPCFLEHPESASCEIATLRKSLTAFRKMAPTYAILHTVPALVFSGKAAVKDPLGFVIKIARKTTYSSLFLSTFVWLVLHGVCIPSRAYEAYGVKIRGSLWYGAWGALTALGLLWEEPHRRSELALYCAPKALASVFAVGEQKGYVKSVPYGEMVVACSGMAMLMHCFIHAPDKMPSLARGVVSQIVDPHTPDRTGKNRRRKPQLMPPSITAGDRPVLIDSPVNEKQLHPPPDASSRGKPKAKFF